MRSIIGILLVIGLQGCANTEWLAVDNCGKMYRPEDVKVFCGEKWDQMSSHPFDAQIRKARGETW